MTVAQVETIGLTVDLERGFGLQRTRQQTLDIDRRLALADLARGRMSDAIDVRIIHRTENALGRVSVERGVKRCDHPVQAGELIVGQVERAIGADG